MPSGPEALFRGIFDNAAVGIVLISLDRRWLEVNQTFCRITGYSADELRRLSVADITHPDDVAADVAGTQQLVAGGQRHYQKEKRYIRKDGEIVWVSVSGSLQRDAEGAPEYFIGVVEDMTAKRLAQGEARAMQVEHVRTAKALHESEDRHAFLLTLSDALRPLTDPVEVQVVAAETLGRFLGVERALYSEIVDEREGIVSRDYAHGLPSMVGRYPLSIYGEEVLAVLRRGEQLIVNDVERDPRLQPSVREAFRSIDVGASMAVSLIKNGRWVGTFSVHSRAPRTWSSSESELLSETAERTWAAVERARAEEALRQSEARLRLALAAPGAGIWSWDPGSGEIAADDRTRAQFGLHPIEPLSFESLSSRIHEEDRAAVVTGLHTAARATSTAPWDAEYRVRQPSGSVAWLYGIGRAERAVPGAMARFTAISLDVTARKEAELAVEALRGEQKEQAETMQRLLETAAQGILSVDADGVIVTANAAVESMFGWEPGTLVGQPLEVLIPLSVRAVHRRLHAEFWAEPAARQMGFRRELLARRKDDVTFPVEVSLNHVGTKSGGRAVAFVTDISARRRADDTLREAHAALEAHAQELQRRADQLGRLASELTLAEQHAREQLAKTLHDHLQQLLFSSRMKLDRLSMRLTDQGTSDADLMSRARDDLDEAIAAARSLAIELFPPMLHDGGLPAALAWLAGWCQRKYGLTVELTADPAANAERRDVRTLVFESVRELLFNVVKHARVETVAVDLSFVDQDDLRIVITDRGIGFDPEVTLRPGESRAPGLGLFSIRERLALLGGHLEVESAPGRGTRFTLIAPRRLASTAVPAIDDPESGARRSTGLRGRPRPLTVLIADDHALVREGLKELLAEYPLLNVVGEAVDGRDAVAQALALQPDVVIMDVSMPEMDGVEATRRIRAAMPSVQVFGLSTRERTDQLHAIELAGATAYFTKGEDSQRLVNTLLETQADRA